MELTDLPNWAQQAGAFIVTISTAAGLAWAERRKRKSADKEAPRGEGIVLSATMADGHAIRDLVEVMKETAREHHRDTRDLGEAVEKLQDAVCDLIRTMKAQAPPDWRDLIERLNKLP